MFKLNVVVGVRQTGVRKPREASQGFLLSICENIFCACVKPGGKEYLFLRRRKTSHVKLADF